LARDAGSPPPTAGSASSTATDGKKKHGLTLGNRFRSKQALEQTPLPPSTPTKAAKLLGVDPSNVHPGGLRGAQYVDGVSDEPSGSRHRAVKEAAARLYDNIDVSDDDEPPKTRGFWGHSKQAAKKLLGSPPSHSPSVAKISRPKWEDMQTDFVDSMTDPVPAQPRRNRQNKQQKDLERMTPITEASHDDMTAAYHGDGDSTELDVINEYTRDSRFQGELAFPPRSQSVQPFLRYELAERDLSSPDGYYEREANDEQEPGYAMHPGAPVDISKLRNKPLPSLQLRSPLQAVEDCLLDATETSLQAKKHNMVNQDESPEEEDDSVLGTPVEFSKAKGKQPEHSSPPPAGDNCTSDQLEDQLQQIIINMDRHEAERLEMDKKVATMKVEHEKFRKNFYAAKAMYDPEKANVSDNACHCCDECKCIGECDCVDADGLKPIRRSIDLDELLKEEPTLHTAIAMPILRVTPGMVKLIDIPPRKKKDTN
jgi:hypothetical protein